MDGSAMFNMNKHELIFTDSLSVNVVMNKGISQFKSDCVKVNFETTHSSICN